MNSLNNENTRDLARRQSGIPDDGEYYTETDENGQEQTYYRIGNEDENHKVYYVHTNDEGQISFINPKYADDPEAYFGNAGGMQTAPLDYFGPMNVMPGLVLDTPSLPPPTDDMPSLEVTDGKETFKIVCQPDGTITDLDGNEIKDLDDPNLQDAIKHAQDIANATGTAISVSLVGQEIEGFETPLGQRIKIEGPNGEIDHDFAMAGDMHPHQLPDDINNLPYRITDDDIPIEDRITRGPYIYDPDRPGDLISYGDSNSRNNPIQFEGSEEHWSQRGILSNNTNEIWQAQRAEYEQAMAKGETYQLDSMKNDETLSDPNRDFSSVLKP